MIHVSPLIVKRVYAGSNLVVVATILLGILQGAATDSGTLQIPVWALGVIGTAILGFNQLSRKFGNFEIKAEKWDKTADGLADLAKASAIANERLEALSRNHLQTAELLNATAAILREMKGRADAPRS